MKSILYKAVFLFVFFGLAGCGEKDKEVNEQTKENELDLVQITTTQFQRNGMQLGTVKELSFPKVISVTGMIDVPPENRAVISATMGGYIKSAPLLIGDRVKKGQLLVTLENPEFIAMQQAYMEVSGQLSYLKSEYERQKTLVEEKITSEKNYLKAESDYKTAFAKYNGLEKQLTLLNFSPNEVQKGKISSVTSLYAPIAGSITKVNVSRGTYVSPAMAILEIINNDHVHLELAVFEKDIMKVKKGQSVDFRIPEASNDVFKGAVHLVGTSIGENRTIKVHAHINNEDAANFLTGMFVEASIITDTKTVMGLPEEAIGTLDDEYFVLKLYEKTQSDYFFERVPVQPIENYNGNSSLDNPEKFEPNAQFLVKGAFSLIGE